MTAEPTFSASQMTGRRPTNCVVPAPANTGQAADVIDLIHEHDPDSDADPETKGSVRPEYGGECWSCDWSAVAGYDGGGDEIGLVMTAGAKGHTARSQR